MATGVPSKETARRKKETIKVQIVYDGKEKEENILSKSYKTFKKIETANESGENKLFFGDNMDALLFMMNNGLKGKIALIYIDPPFATSFNFVNREQIHAYSDSLCGGEYVEFLRQRLIVMRELLKPNGSIYLHLDGNMAFTMKLIMDEVFGEKNCRAFITRKK